jgi:hypothetical protein|nr:MAG TPA: hypothetical protein [Caudoviricetes sp.]
MGRYYHTAESQFVDGVFKPDLQLAMKALLNEQQQYDTQKAVLEEFMNLKFNHLNSEEENENARIAKEYYMQNADDIAKAMMADKQNYHKYMDRIKGLRRDLISDFEDGPIGKMVNNYNQEQAWKKENAGILKENPALYNALFNEARKNWGGNSVTGGVWQQENGFKAFDQQAIENNIQKMESDIKKNSRQTSNGTWIYDDGYEVKELTEQDIRNYAVNKVLSDPSAMAYFKQSDRLGLSNYLNPDGSLNENGTLSNWLDAIRSYAYRKEDTWHKMKADPYGLKSYGYELQWQNKKKEMDYKNQLETPIIAVKKSSDALHGTPEQYQDKVKGTMTKIAEYNKILAQYGGDEKKIPKELLRNLKPTEEDREIERVWNKQVNKNIYDAVESGAISKNFFEKYGVNVDRIKDLMNKDNISDKEIKELENSLSNMRKVFDTSYKDELKENKYKNQQSVFFVDGKYRKVFQDQVLEKDYTGIGGGFVYKPVKYYIDESGKRINIDDSKLYRPEDLSNKIYSSAKEQMAQNYKNQNRAITTFTVPIDWKDKKLSELKNVLGSNTNALQDFVGGKVRQQNGRDILSSGKQGEIERFWFWDTNFNSFVEAAKAVMKNGDAKDIFDPNFFSWEYVPGTNGQEYQVTIASNESVKGNVDNGRTSFRIRAKGISSNIDQEYSKQYYRTDLPEEDKQALLKQNPFRQNFLAKGIENFGETSDIGYGKSTVDYSNVLPGFKTDIIKQRSKDEGGVYHDYYVIKPNFSNESLNNQARQVFGDGYAVTNQQEAEEIFGLFYDGIVNRDQSSLNVLMNKK